MMNQETMMISEKLFEKIILIIALILICTVLEFTFFPDSITELNEPNQIQKTNSVNVKLIKPKLIFTNTKIKYNNNDLHCLTKNIYYEAGIESEIGKYAVAHVTLNRLIKGNWGSNICQVVYSKAQFSWTLRRRLAKPYRELWNQSEVVAKNVLNGWRLSGLEDSLFYHADYVTPYWIDRNARITQVDHHVFYKTALLAAK